MRSNWPAFLRGALGVFLLAPAAVAQDRATEAQDQAQPDGSSTTQKSLALPAPDSPLHLQRSDASSTAKKSAAAKPKARRNDSGRSTPDDTAGTSSSSSSPSTTVPKTELATFGAGCFWHVEDIFERQKGVKNAVSGYSGGNIAYPSYEMVHTGETGHAEVVQVEYDPNVITYEALLKIFWRSHDPTSINRQGEDEGPQYRSVIFYHSDAQRKAALKSYEQLTRARAFRTPIVTQLMPMQAFFPAEDYHQNYYSGMRRTASRRRKPASPKVKQAQTKSKGAAHPAQKSPSTPAPANDGSASPRA